MPVGTLCGTCGQLIEANVGEHVCEPDRRFNALVARVDALEQGMSALTLSVIEMEAKIERDISNLVSALRSLGQAMRGCEGALKAQDEQIKHFQRRAGGIGN